jgi:hypothetical protein
MGRALAVLPPLAIVLLLAGCASEQGVIYNRSYDAAWRPTEFWTQSGGRDLRTEIYGNPFAMDQDAFVAVVTEAMKGAHFGPQTNFVPVPGENASDSSYRVRMVFNGAYSNGSALCDQAPTADPAASPAPAKGEIRLLAAYCGSGDRLSAVNAGIEGVSGPDDPNFRTFIRNVTMALFPPVNPERDNNRCFVPNC